jgi:hypothetical protein
VEERKSISRQGYMTRRPAQERQARRAAGGRAGVEGTRADGRFWEVGADGRDTACARARTNRPCGRMRERQRAAGCMRATQCDACGPHNAGRMQTCERTGRWENGTGHGEEGTPHPTDTVKGMTWPLVVMHSASLVRKDH